MQATNGLAVLFRTRARLMGCSILALALMAMLLASSARADPRKTYLALGDSLAFGYSQQLFNENFPGENPKKFEHGYTNDYLAALKAAEPTANWQPLINDGCPGETTDSLIGSGTLAKEMIPLGAEGENPCKYHYGALPPEKPVKGELKFKLHNEYRDTHSQLENVLEEIKRLQSPGQPVDHVLALVSLNIGANDELRAVHKCEAEVQHEFETEGKSKYGTSPEEAVKVCLQLNAFPLFKHINTNISAMLHVIRNGSEYCVNVKTTPCDANHKGSNYKGKIIVVLGYDPYGRVFCAGESFASPGNAPASCVPGNEVLPESNTLTAIANFETEKAVDDGDPYGPFQPFEACTPNPQPVFDPSIVGKPENEPFQLQTLTNMDNKTTSKGLPNGNGKTSDIHPTPLGYTVMSEIMAGTCGV